MDRQKQKQKEKARKLRAKAKVRSRYDRELIESLRSLIVDYLDAKEVYYFDTPNGYSGCCPIHDDNRPSFSVFGENHQRWKCFACNKGGDIFDLSIAMGLARNFREAVREVAQALGLEIPDSEGEVPVFEADTPARSEPERTPTNLNDDEKEGILATRYMFRRAVRRTPKLVRDIAASTGIPADTLKQAARGDSGLGLVANRLTYVYPTGLKVRNPKGMIPRFYWQLGRPDAPWRFERIALRKAETVYLTEGESDALALLAAGVEENSRSAVVASPGTSFPRHWASLFAGKDVVICFDFDAPGQAAAAEVARLLETHARSVSILRPR